MSTVWNPERLARLQQAFVERVRQGPADPHVSEPATEPETEPETELSSALRPIQRLSLRQALNVYARDYAARLHAVLADRFASLAFILGPERFQSLTREYLQFHPSGHWDLGRCGEALPAFLSEHVLRADYPFLPELARLECAFWTLFDAPAPVQGDLNGLETCADPGALRFELTELSLFASDWPLRELWTLQKQSPQAEALPKPAPQWLVIYRNQAGVSTSLLTRGQYHLLQSLAQSASLSEALEALESEPGSDIEADEVSQLFALLRREGLILGVSTSASRSSQ